METAMNYGYARVSTADQSLVAQAEALKAAGCEKIYEEKISGATTERRELKKLLKKMERDDTLLVTRLDRLCRNMRDMLNILHDLNERGINFRSLKEDWANLGSATGKLLLHVLSATAEFERELIKSRVDEGRRRAMANGVKFGRRSKLSDYQRKQAAEMILSGKTQGEVARLFEVDQSTISYQLRQIRVDN
jgi:DNA invertase Pin-like site-specific DNA recombinase